MKSFIDENIFESPRVLKVQIEAVLLILLICKWVPVSIVSSYGANVLLLHLQALLVVHLVSLDQPSLWVFQGPDHPCNHC